MNNIDVSNIIQPFRDAIENKDIRSAYMYAFKTKNIRTSASTYASLDYEFFDVTMPKPEVIHAFKNILDFFQSKFLSKETTIFEKYSISNPKNVIDFIELPILDSSNHATSNETAENLDTDTYKIQYFLNLLDTNCKIADNKRDYIYYKHSIIKLTTNNNDSIFIVNKVSPIYKPQGFLFTFNTDDPDDDDLDNNFKPLQKKLFKLPFWPHIIIVNNYCFLIEPDVESIFGFEKFNKKTRDNVVTNLKNQLSLSEESFNFINSYCNTGRNYNLFANFNNTRYEKIKTNDSETISLLQNKIGISLDSNFNINITDQTQAEKIVLYLCDCLFQGIEEPNLYEAKNSRAINS